MTFRAGAQRSGRRAMTLVEVLVTVAIMSILATVVGFAVFQLHVREQKKIARMNASLLRRAAAVWRLNRPVEECPSFARLLADGIIDREANPTDPWGSPYVMTCAHND